MAKRWGWLSAWCVGAWLAAWMGCSRGDSEQRVDVHAAARSEPSALDVIRATKLWHTRPLVNGSRLLAHLPTIHRKKDVFHGRFEDASRQPACLGGGAWITQLDCLGEILLGLRDRSFGLLQSLGLGRRVMPCELSASVRE